jgi:peptidoglycan/xylan/chitin deacetylase (PgdA/CDA1 family)
MLRLPGPAAPLAASERYALEQLADLARLVPVDDAAADVVCVEVSDEPRDPGSLAVAAARGWHLTVRDGAVGVPRSVLRLLAGVTSARAERESSARDRHGRVPPAANALVTESLERDPVVSRAARALRHAVARAAGTRPVYLAVPWPGGRRWAAAVTHDLDVASWWPLFTGLRAAELAGKGELRLVLRVLGAALSSAAGDPVTAGAAALLEDESAHGVPATWFVICGTPTVATFTAGDITYLPEARRPSGIVRAAAAAGHALGLHGSFATMEEDGRFAMERRRLETIAARPVAGVRQHFLRFRPFRTQRAMAAAGFTYDSSYGFPDRNGFRLGAADVIPLWDEDAGQGIALDEAPVTWMDRALSKYRADEAPDSWVDDALALAATCRDLEGLWVGVWHPNLVPALGFPGAPRAFRRLLDELAAHDPCFDTLDRLVAWRRARRAVRVRALAPDGRVEVATTGDPSVPLETLDGGPVRGVDAARR